MKDRIYVCHTYYHVLVSVIKELNMPNEGDRGASIMLSSMSIDFENIKDRLDASGIFDEVIPFPEKQYDYFPELVELKKNRGNIVLNLFARVKYTKKLAKYLEPYVPVDMRQYKDIYVYCDSDPIGTYLNQNKIYYHAVEDGLDTLKPLILAKYDNRGAFGLKKFMSLKLNMIFICDGYSKYCLDMEVNDLSCIEDDFYKYKEVPREPLYNNLTPQQREKVLKIFVRRFDELKEKIEKSKNADTILVLTEPLCDLEVRKQIFKDIVDMYSKDGQIVLKPHPRDELDYTQLFPDLLCFDGTVPMEMFRFIDGLRFKKIISVFTQLANINFAEEKVYLGDDFMDKYEAPEIHRKKA